LEHNQLCIGLRLCRKVIASPAVGQKASLLLAKKKEDWSPLNDYGSFPYCAYYLSTFGIEPAVDELGMQQVLSKSIPQSLKQYVTTEKTLSGCNHEASFWTVTMIPFWDSSNAAQQGGVGVHEALSGIGVVPPNNPIRRICWCCTPLQ
jgi:hypothetical protein